jgi:hypothetical protein
MGLMATNGSTGANASNNHVWIDGTDLEYLDWLPDQPSGEDACTSIRKAAANDTSPSAWQSSGCANQLAFLCKVASTVAAQLDLLANITTSPPVSPAPPAYQYPSTTMMLNNSTYLLYEQAANFSTASMMCGSVGGHLASAHSALESQLLQELCAASSAGSCWLGLTATASNGTYKWVDGSTIDWLPAQSLASEAGCVHIVPSSNTLTPGSWQTTDCAAQLSFLCKVDSTVASHLDLYGISPSPAPSSSPNFTIPSSSMMLNNNTYLLYEQAANFSTASMMCGNVGGHLASAHSALESQLLQDLCLYATIPNCWLGLAGTPAGNYSWVDGTTVDFLAWQEAHPMSGDECSYVAAGQSGNATGSSSHAWRSSGCGEQLPFLCRFDSTAASQLNLYGISPSPSPVVPPSSPSSTYPIKNMMLNNSTYLLYEEAADFAAAMTRCQSVGGHLASAHSAVESYLLEDLCAASDAGSCWLGLREDAASDGSTMDWLPADTLNETGPCVHVQLPITNGSMIWQGGSCNTQRSIMCKVDSTAASQLNLYGISPSPSISSYSRPAPWSPAPESPAPWSPTPYSSPPPSYTMVLNNSTYMLYEQPANFSSAEQQCTAVGGQLASAHNPLENQVLLELCGQANMGDCWFGLIPDGQTNSSYSWTDGTAFDFFAWSPNYPGEYGQTACGYIAANTSGSNSTSLWKVALCDYPLAFVCKVDSSSTSELQLHSNVSAAVDVKVLNGSCTTTSQAGKHVSSSLCRMYMCMGSVLCWSQGRLCFECGRLGLTVICACLTPSLL